jgi:acyl-CoA synthetase (AMP-forming)/AMP-acid ligase II
VSTAWLLERMAAHPDDPAIIWMDRAYSYGDLLGRIAMWREELARQGVGAGSVVLLEGGFSPNACGLLLALIEVGAIAVPLTPQVRAHREKFEEIAEVQVALDFADNDSWSLTRHDRQVSNALARS